MTTHLERRSRWKPWRAARHILTSVYNDPAVESDRLMAVARAVGWNFRKRVWQAAEIHDLVPGVRICCYPDSSLGSKVIYLGGFTDHHQGHFLKRYLRPGDRVLDCGSNIGTYTLLLAHVIGPEGRVHAFEPHPVLRARLLENLRLNDFQSRVQVHGVALSNVDAQLEFESDRDVSSRLVASSNSHTVTVDAARLDSLGLEGPFAFAKADVEGAEAELLEGASGLLRRYPPDVWLVEAEDHLLEARGSSRRQLNRLLEAGGYRLGTYSSVDGLLPTGFETAHDVFAVRADRWNHVLSRLQSAD